MYAPRVLPPPDGDPYDFALVGAGAAGLCLARGLAERFPAARILLVDPGFGDLAARTFAFWSEGPPPLAEAVERTWAKIRIASPERVVERELTAHRYHVIGGARFRDHCLAHLAARGGVHHHRGGAAAVVSDDVEARITGEGLWARARWAFDSRVDLAAVPAHPSENVVLTQRFLGWEVGTATDAFDPDVATLFDFRVEPGPDDVRFVYVLPFGPRRALVEHVSLRPGGEKEALAAYVRDVLGVAEPEILRVESGSSPLTDAVFPRRAGPRHLRIGIAGGRLKPSSGYAFTRIVEDSAAIVASLAAHGHPFDGLPETNEAFRLLDGLFLRVMRREPARMKQVFLRLFERNPPARVFRFLDERVGVEDVLALGSSLPPGPFARALAGAQKLRLVAAVSRLKEPVPYEGP